MLAGISLFHPLLGGLGRMGCHCPRLWTLVVALPLFGWSGCWGQAPFRLLLCHGCGGVEKSSIVLVQQASACIHDLGSQPLTLLEIKLADGDYRRDFRYCFTQSI
jgi:hypothetical protein